MPSSVINSDDGVISGTSGLKSSGGDDGVLVFQSKGTETARINTDKQIVAAAGTASLPALTTTGDVNTGIFFPAADTIAFGEGGAEAMRIDSSGNVCVGSTAAGNAGALNVSVGLAGTTAGGIQLWSSTTAAHSIQWGDGTSSTDPYRGYIEYAHNGDSMRFATQSTERARINSSGDLLVGTTTASGKLTSVTASTTTAAGYFITPASFTGSNLISLSSTASGTGWDHLICYSNVGGTTNLRILGNGNVQNANNSYGALSDIKLKENIVDATPKLDDLMQVQVRHYNFIGDEQKQLGVIAQELEQIFPGMVEESPDRDAEGNDLGTTTKSVKYSVFVPMLIKAIQELSAKNDALEARLSALEQA